MFFSDIEGSTRLLARLGPGYADVLAVQRNLVRAAIGRWNGSEMGTEGDSFFVVFPSARDAVSATVDLQRCIDSQDWPDGVKVQLRIGLHSGEPEPFEDGYVGFDVHLAARIAAAAHGGQVLVSEATRRLVSAQVPEGCRLKALGSSRLKDITELQPLHQLEITGLPTDFPPPRTLGAGSNVPTPPTPLIGREVELVAVTDLLTRAERRLVTLTGPGGSGKTRLAIAVAQAVSDGHPDGVYFVPLSTVTEEPVVWTTVAQALGLTGESKSPPTFFEHIVGRRLLLVLDNLEQLAGAAAAVVRQLLDASPDLRVLGTSRRPLHLPGEQEYAVEPLEVAGPGSGPMTVERAARVGAVALFVQYAQLVRPGFRLSESNVEDVLTLCRRLDGLPLAVELAAARSKVLTPAALLEHLNSSLDLAASGIHRPARQQTLRAAVEWSHNLLDPHLQQTFRKLAVFAGGADLDAISAVCGGAVVERVSELVDASLVRVDDHPGGPPRFALLNTIQSFALEQLEKSGELDAARQRHAEHYVELAEGAHHQLRGPNVLAARDLIERDLDNLRAALTWTLGETASADAARTSRRAVGVRLCAGLGWFWYTSGYVEEGRHWCARASLLASPQQGAELAGVLHPLGVLLLQQGDVQKGRDVLAKCLRIWERIGDRSKIAMELNSLGLAYRALGQSDRARRLLERSAGVARDIGEERRLATALSNLAMLEMDLHPDRAIDLLAQAEEIDRKQGDVWAIATDQVNRVTAYAVAGRADEAVDLLNAIAADVIGLGDTDLTVGVIELFAVCSAASGDARRTARLTGAAAALRSQAGLPLSAPDAAFLERLISPAREALDSTAWTLEHGVGARMTAAEALTHAEALLQE